MNPLNLSFNLSLSAAETLNESRIFLTVILNISLLAHMENMASSVFSGYDM